MGLRHQSNLIHGSHSSNQIDRSSNAPSNHQSNPRLHSSSMVTNYTKSNLIELNSQSDESCLVVISKKVYDLTLWIEDQSFDSNLIHQLRTLAKLDPLNAGDWLLERLHDQSLNCIAECRIGDLDWMELQSRPHHQISNLMNSNHEAHLHSSDHHHHHQTHHSNLNRNDLSQPNHNIITDQQLTPSTSSQEPSRRESNRNSNSNQNSTSSSSSSSSSVPTRRSHLSRALALVEYYKSLVIAAEANVGSAHLSLSEAFEGLTEAEKKRDHLIMLACEGFRPTLPEWESLED
ncbi:hypothetical protein DFH28DRAFT_886297 [Melampsora americana]|nr:hypothetical protein DFH28DRAFT_886297 [Melampsora americana]